MIEQTITQMFETLSKPPVACAMMQGSSEIHNLTGAVYVYPFLEGSLVVADIEGIPFSGFYGFHIHQHGPCIMGEEGYTGFHDVGGHFSTNPDAPHPYHTGDLPVLMSFYGHAFTAVYTDRFTPEQILGRAMIIHEWPDDYRTQPTGNAGQHIGCGTFFPCCFCEEGYFGGMDGFQLGDRLGTPRVVPPPSGPQDFTPLEPQPIGPPGAPPVVPSLTGPTGGLPGPLLPGGPTETPPITVPGTPPATIPGTPPGTIPGIMPPRSPEGTTPGTTPPGTVPGTPPDTIPGIMPPRNPAGTTPGTTPPGTVTGIPPATTPAIQTTDFPYSELGYVDVRGQKKVRQNKYHDSYQLIY